MSIFDLFSKRQKRLRGEAPDVYTYDRLPEPLRAQIVHIWHDTLGGHDNYAEHVEVRQVYEFIVSSLCREYGLFQLPGERTHRYRHFLGELTGFLLGTDNHERALDTVELAFRAIDRLTRDHAYLHRTDAGKLADAAITELNTRFREHGVGFQYADGEIVRVDSELLHVETVLPALTLLRDVEYAGAQAEFLTAHEHFRHGRSKEALAECLKSLESVMKSICVKRHWTYDPVATSTGLIQVLVEKELIPRFWTQHFTALRSTLESGVPTARNKLGGHGQGPQVVKVPQQLVAYVLHLTASGIVFLVESEKALP